MLRRGIGQFAVWLGITLATLPASALPPDTVRGLDPAATFLHSEVAAFSEFPEAFVGLATGLVGLAVISRRRRRRR